MKTRKPVRGEREHWRLWLQWRGRVWLQQRPSTGVWAGLWTLPLFDDEAALARAAQVLGVRCEAHATIKHAMTHYEWTLHTMRAVLTRRPADASLGMGQWVADNEVSAFALPAPLKRLLNVG